MHFAYIQETSKWDVNFTCWLTLVFVLTRKLLITSDPVPSPPPHVMTISNWQHKLGYRKLWTLTWPKVHSTEQNYPTKGKLVSYFGSLTVPDCPTSRRLQWISISQSLNETWCSVNTYTLFQTNQIESESESGSVKSHTYVFDLKQTRENMTGIFVWFTLLSSSLIVKNQCFNMNEEKEINFFCNIKNFVYLISLACTMWGRCHWSLNQILSYV